jgi:hypothetical protein
MLHRQPSSKDPARRSLGAIWAYDILGLQKVVKVRAGWGRRGRAANFVAFNCTSQEKAAHGHVVYAVQEGVENGVKGAQNGSYCPGNERCAVESLPVRCRFRVCRTAPPSIRYCPPSPLSIRLCKFYIRVSFAPKTPLLLWYSKFRRISAHLKF